MATKFGEVITKWQLDVDEMKKNLSDISGKLDKQKEKFDSSSVAAGAFGVALGNIATAALGKLADSFSELKRIALDTEDWIGKDTKAIDGMREASGGLISNLNLMKARTQLMNGDLQLSEEQLQAVTKAAIIYTRVNKTDFTQSLNMITDAIQSGTMRSVKGLGISIETTGTVAQKQGQLIEAVTSRYKDLNIQATNTNEVISSVGSTFENLVGHLGNAILQGETFQKILKKMYEHMRDIDEEVSKSPLRKEFEQVALQLREAQERLRALQEDNFSWRNMFLGERLVSKNVKYTIDAIDTLQKRYDELSDKIGKTGETVFKSKEYFESLPFEPEPVTLSSAEELRKRKEAELAKVTYTQEELYWKQLREEQEAKIALSIAAKDENLKYFESNLKLLDSEFELEAARNRGLETLAKQIKAQKEHGQILSDLASGPILSVTNAIGEQATAMIFAGQSASNAGMMILSALADSLAAEAQMQAAKQLAMALGSTFTNPVESATHWAAFAAWQTAAIVAKAGGSGLSKSATTSRSSSPSVRASAATSPSSVTPTKKEKSEDRVINIYLGNPGSPIANLIATKTIKNMVSK